MKKITLAAVAGAMLIGAATAAPGAVLSVNAASNTWKTINPRIYGINIANWAADHYLRLCQPLLTNARVSVVRYGATNIERYNWKYNRMYNVISKENQYVPLSWSSFIEWCREINAEPFLQASVFGHVASDVNSNDYNEEQSPANVAEWVRAAGTNVNIWGVGNEPFIAWKLEHYEGERNNNSEGYAYRDGAHGDQIYLEDLAPDRYFPRWLAVGAAIRGANPQAKILGPTPANWYLYWGSDYSKFCPATRADPGAHHDDPGWFIMSSGVNQFDGRVFPGRAGQPDIVGWERNEQTGKFNDKRNMNQFVKRVAEYAATHGGTQVCDYLDFHRYMNCDQDAVAVQETRDLWDPDYASYDKETGGGGAKTMILNRFQNIIDHYYTNMHLSLSEYDFFYWQGHPAEPQIAALGQVDYLGIFAQKGVQLACNWYVGEPDQSGGGYDHAADSAKQAMFTERGEPNPKYWAFYLMSHYYRDQAVAASSSDHDRFSVYAGLNRQATQLVVTAFYKGLYTPWWDTNRPGAYIEGQGPSNAMLVVSNFNITGVRRVQRYGRYDPDLVHLQPGSVALAGNSFTYAFEPLAIYVFTFDGTLAPPAEDAPASYLRVTPARIQLGPYDTGMEVHAGVTNYHCFIRITNNRRSNTTWSVSEDAPWLGIHGPTSGAARVTDRVALTCDRAGLAVGIYTTVVRVVTSEGTVQIPVSMEVIPRAAGGEARISDFETGSLSHNWGLSEPYAIGFFDQHGQPPDREWPYIYMMSLDYNEHSALGGMASMRVDFNRANGDTGAGRLYLAFGTYGHRAGLSNAPTTMWAPPGANLSNYVFKFDVKTKTEGPGYTRTRFVVLVTDTNNNVGKPDVGLASFKDSIEVDDGYWQTIAIPLATNFFDWRYPEGQDGRLTRLNFACIRQLEFIPWVGHEDKRGTIWLDNLRIESLADGSNRYPVAVAGQDLRLIGTNATVHLTATNSYDPDGTIAAYAWSPATGLSATNVANPTFFPPAPGDYIFELVVTDNRGLKSRNPAQVVVNCQPTLYPERIQFFRDSEMTDEIIGVASNSLDLYLKMTCFAGGVPTIPDFTLARVYTSDSYGPDAHNRVVPINVVLEETGPDTKVFTGRLRLAAFSDELRAQIGCAEGATITVSNNNYFTSRVVGRQTYGGETPIDHIEDGSAQFNAFGGIWCAYDDRPNGNTSVVTMAAVMPGATSNSTQCMRGTATLGLTSPALVDQLFAGIMTKLTAYTNDLPGVSVTDLSSTSGYKGLSFWLKGNGTKVSVVLKSLAITNYDDYLYTIEHTPSNGWRKYQLLFTDFEQEGWGNQAVERDTALCQIAAIQFKFASKIGGEHGEVFVDDLALFGRDRHYLPHGVYRKQNRLSMEGFGGGLLTNAAFNGPGAPGWVLSGNAMNEEWGNWRIALENWTGTNTGEAWQSVPVQGGEAYQFSIGAWKNAGFNGQAYMELAWYDAASNHLGTDSKNITADLTNVLQTFTLPWRWAPPTASRVRVRVRTAGGVVPPYADNAVQFDDAEFVKYGLEADDGWISGWIGGEAIAYSTNCAEGSRAMRISTTNRGWLAGMFVAPYGLGVTRTNFAAFDGFALRARRVPEFTNTGSAAARIRLAVATNEDPVARTRWYPVGASVWEDPILFAKDQFLTAATVDAADPAAWRVWSNDWRNISRIIIEYGPSRESNAPYALLLDDFRPYSDEYVADDITDPPVTNSTAMTNVLAVYRDAGIPAGTMYCSKLPTGASANPNYVGANPPEGVQCMRGYMGPDGEWSIAYTQSCFVVGRWDTPNLAWNVDVSGNYAYVADTAGGLRIINIANPTNPVEVASKMFPDYARDVDVVGNYAYVASRPFKVLNVSNPANPVEAGSLDIGSAFAVEVSGNYAYIVRRDNARAIAIVNIANPSNPVLTGTASMGSVDCHVRVSNNYAYVALQDSGFHVINVATPSAPVILTTNWSRYYTMGVDLYQNYALVGGYGGMDVYDISTPSSPCLAGSVAYPGYTRDIRVVGNRAYVVGDTRLRIFDLSVPTNPALMGYSQELAADAYGVEVVGQYAYVAAYTAGLQVVSVANVGGSSNLFGYLDGFLRFAAKTPVNLSISMGGGGGRRTCSIQDFNWSGQNTWQEFVIPLRSLKFTAAELERVFELFVCKPSAPATEYFIDNIRITNQY